MENFPHPSEWIRLPELAKKLNCSYDSAYKLASRGVTKNGKTIKLKTYRTIRGIVTTDAEIKLMHRLLNE